jgi:hypothetical protein
MPYYKFKQNDIFHNRIKAHPKKKFFIYDSSIFLDDQSQVSGAFTGSVPNVPTGHVSLYEVNVDRHDGTDAPKLIHPFVPRSGNLTAFRTISTSSFYRTEIGENVSSSYPLSASIHRQLYGASTTRDQTANKISALKNTLNYYIARSPHYEYSSSVGRWNKAQDAINLISIPSIFYGSSIKKGSINLKFYMTGTLIGELKDENYSGELIQTGPEGSVGSGSVAGVALYNEGFLLLTGSWNLDSMSGLDYTNTNTATRSSWLYYGVGANDGIPAETHTANSRLSASYSLEFSGTNYVPVVTMLAHAPRNELNYSSNPSYIDQTSDSAFVFYSSSAGYVENDKQTIKNTVKSPYVSPTGSYKPQTFISKIGIFDKDKNLIAIAKVANPVKKTEDRELTFKLKLDF